MQHPDYDHYIKSPSMVFTGLHLLLDMSGIACTNAELIDSLDKCLAHINATVLHKNIHHFDENNGISGCYTLAESHLSFHSWWEAGGVLILDFFTCGDTNPLNALEMIKTTLNPKKTKIRAIPRGSVFLSENEDNFDVFMLFDPNTDLPMYVGHGSKSAIEIITKNKNVCVHTVTTDTSKEMAVLIETYLIDFYGKKTNGGSLSNIIALDKPCHFEKIADILHRYATFD